MTEIDLKIEGMSCQHCVMRVRKAMDGLAGITRADVSIGTARIQYDESKIAEEGIEGAVEKAGYKVVRSLVVK